MKKLFLLPLLLLVFLYPTVEARAEGELFRLEVPFVEGATVKAIRPNGTTTQLGTVLALPEHSRWPSYTASKWGRPGCVVASAVNACHLLLDVEEERGRTISLIPARTLAPAAGPGAALVIDTPAGTGLFGGWAPTVGTPVQVLSPEGHLDPLNPSHFPVQGDTLVMTVKESSGPYMVDIENRKGGKVTAWYDGTGNHVLAEVIRPVKGVGRFGGSIFQEGSRLRANHPGVICISTSPPDQVGGFQILPWTHAHSPEMKNAWELTQWLIIRPLSGTLEGQEPLFSGQLIPGTAPGEELWDLWSTYGRKSLILARFDNGPWIKLPSKTGRNDKGLEGLTHLRIYFPFSREPLSS